MYTGTCDIFIKMVEGTIAFKYSQTYLKGHLYITNQSIKGSLIFPINE